MMLSILADSGGFWMPTRASTHAGGVDSLFSFLLWLSVFFFSLIAVLMAVFVVKYRYRGEQKEPPPAGHSTALELTWTIIPTILVIIIFYFGFRGYLSMSVAPPNAYEIQVSARMWQWAFTYPNGHESDELHVPVDTPVRLVMTSQDVIHSLYIPQFRLKKDVVPGRYIKTWFQATQTGTFDIYCAEYCGQKHSQMLTKIVVHEPHEFRQWLETAQATASQLSPLDRGRSLFTRQGCAQCHSTDGTRVIGPTFKDMYGSTRTFKDGSTVAADENYIRESLLEPGKRVVAGFEPSMNSYQGALSEPDINAIITYLKSMSVHYKPDPTTQPATAPARP